MQGEDSLELQVQLMDDPCLWRWNIRDPSRAEVVASSWCGEWMAYPSADEAYQAGRECLHALEAARATPPLATRPHTSAA